MNSNSEEKYVHSYNKLGKCIHNNIKCILNTYKKMLNIIQIIMQTIA